MEMVSGSFAFLALEVFVHVPLLKAADQNWSLSLDRFPAIMLPQYARIFPIGPGTRLEHVKHFFYGFVDMPFSRAKGWVMKKVHLGAGGQARNKCYPAHRSGIYNILWCVRPAGRHVAPGIGLLPTRYPMS